MAKQKPSDIALDIKIAVRIKELRKFHLIKKI